MKKLGRKIIYGTTGGSHSSTTVAQGIVSGFLTGMYGGDR